MRHTMFNTPVVKSLLRGISLFLLKILGWKTTGVTAQGRKICSYRRAAYIQLGFVLWNYSGICPETRCPLHSQKRIVPRTFFTADDMVGSHSYRQVIVPPYRWSKWYLHLKKMKNLFSPWRPKAPVIKRIAGNQDFIILLWMPMFPFYWRLLIMKVKPAEQVL